MHLQNTCVKKCVILFSQWNLKTPYGNTDILSKWIAERNVSALRLITQCEKFPGSHSYHLSPSQQSHLNVVYSTPSGVWAHFYPGKETVAQ